MPATPQELAAGGLGGPWNRHFLPAAGGARPANTFISDFWLPDRDSKYLLLDHLVCRASFRRP